MGGGCKQIEKRKEKKKKNPSGSATFSPVRVILEHSQGRCKTNGETGGRGINPAFLCCFMLFLNVISPPPLTMLTYGFRIQETVCFKKSLFFILHCAFALM